MQDFYIFSKIPELHDQRKRRKVIIQNNVTNSQQDAYTRSIISKWLEYY